MTTTTTHPTTSAVWDLPPRFYDDHVERDLPAGVVVRRTTTRVWVELTPAEHADLLSDADYYADPSTGLGSSYLGLVSSARATLRALDRPGVPVVRPIVDQLAQHLEHRGDDDQRFDDDEPPTATELASTCVDFLKDCGWLGHDVDVDVDGGCRPSPCGAAAGLVSWEVE